MSVVSQSTLVAGGSTMKKRRYNLSISSPLDAEISVDDKNCPCKLNNPDNISCLICSNSTSHFNMGSDITTMNAKFIANTRRRLTCFTTKPTKDQLLDRSRNSMGDFVALESERFEHTSRYCLEGKIGDSLYGCVRRAYDRLRKQTVAIKISVKMMMDAQQCQYGQIVENVRREATLLRYLTCPETTHVGLTDLPPGIELHPGRFGFATFIQELEDDEYHYLVTEFIDGGELFQLVDKAGAKDNYFTNQQQLDWFRQIMDAVDYMHSLHVVHLDLSLENVCVTSDNRIKLIDLGQATISASAQFYKRRYPQPIVLPKTDDDSQKFPLWFPTFRVGKMGYMSPEVMNHQQFDGFAHDLYCIGVMLYMIVTLRPPYPHVEPQSSPWFTHLITGSWVSKSFMTQNGRIYKAASPEVLDLIDKLIKYEPVRISMEQVRQHPWLAIK